MEAYCKKTGASSQGLKFVFDGKVIKDDDTPNSLSLENDDCLDVLLQQQGGGRCAAR